MVHNMYAPAPNLKTAPPTGGQRLIWRMAAGGRFEIRLTRDVADITAAQRLRYHVFYEEMGAVASSQLRLLQRDEDEFDVLCDHLLVLDLKRPANEAVVGTYRLLPQAIAERFGRFYSTNEFDLQPLLHYAGAQGGLLEVGRSCVHPDYRTSATIKLLWRGIARYIADNNITYLFGCASLAGVQPEKHAAALTYLYHHHRVPPELSVRALAHRYVSMSSLDSVEQIDVRSVFRSLPPLVKAYLRLGCYIGDGAVIDADFGTTDIFILLPVERIDPRYLVVEDGSESVTF